MVGARRINVSTATYAPCTDRGTTRYGGYLTRVPTPLYYWLRTVMFLHRPLSHLHITCGRELRRTRRRVRFRRNHKTLPSPSSRFIRTSSPSREKATPCLSLPGLSLSPPVSRMDTGSGAFISPHTRLIRFFTCVENNPTCKPICKHAPFNYHLDYV